MALPGDTYIERLNKARSFYETLAEREGLHWLCWVREDHQHDYLFNVVRNYEEVYLGVRRLYAARTALIGLALVGWYALVFGLCALILGSAPNGHPMNFGRGLAFGTLVGWLAPLWLALMAYRKSRDLIESWIKVHWKYPEFEEWVARIHNVSHEGARDILWMERDTSGRVIEAAPESVVLACEAALVEHAFQVKNCERASGPNGESFSEGGLRFIEAQKREFNALFQACRRLGVLRRDVDPRVYWNKAIVAVGEGFLKKRQAPPSAPSDSPAS